MTTLYGIKNCDTVKKARQWLDNQGIAYQFHDFRADGINSNTIELWISNVGWENLVNKRSTTWKQLDQASKDTICANNAAAIILEHPTLIKRPLLELGKAIHLGFKESDYQTIFKL